MTMLDPVLDEIERRPSSTETLIELMCSAPAFRDRARIGELRERIRIVGQDNPPRAEWIARIVADLEKIHDCLDAAPGEGTVASLNRWLATHRYGGVTGIRWLALRRCRDARAGGDHAMRRRLIGMMCAYRTLDRFNAALVGSTLVEITDAVFAETAMPAEDYIAWLAIRGRGDDDHAKMALRMHEQLAEFQRIRTPIRSAVDPDGEPRRRATHDEAERWIESSAPLVNRCIRVVGADGDPAHWPALVTSIVAWTIETLEISRERRGSATVEDAAAVHVTAVLCEVALRNGPPELSEPALATYREAVTGAAYATLPLPVRETYAYYYIYALVRSWQRLRDPEPVLRDAVALGQSVLKTAEPSRAARLIRDLHFACARLCERLGEWDRALFERACDHYRRGLAVAELAFEREPRARALSDLANTLHRSGLGTNDEVEALFEDALRLVPLHETSSYTAVVRLNYAIFLFERIGTTEAKAQALAQLEDAERAYGHLDSASTTTRWNYEALTSIWMTRANIRRDDGSESSLLEAIAIYDRAAARLPDDPWLRPIHCQLALNRCQSYLDLHRDRADLVAARAAVRQAASLAIDDAARADVQLYEVLVGLAAGDPIDALLPMIDHCFATSRDAGGLLRSLSVMAWRARLGAATGRDAELEQALRLFRTGHDAAARANLVSEQLHHGRGFADVSVKRWRRTGASALLDDAVAVLVEVAAAIEAQLEADVLLVDPDNAHAQLAAVAADLAWLRATAGQPVALVLRDATIAKGPDVNGELLLNVAMAALAPDAASAMAGARRDDWAIRRRVMERGVLDHRVAADVAALRESAARRAIAIGRRRSTMVDRAIDLARLRPERGGVVDITVARWGCVVIVIPSDPQRAPIVSCSPFHLSTLEHLQSRWLEAYAPDPGSTRDSTPRDVNLAMQRSAVRDTIEAMLDAIARDLLGGVLCEIEGLERVVWIPHVLAGMPLHAVRSVTGRRLIETTGAVGYATSTAATPARSLEPNWNGAKVLCLAVDPGETHELVEVCREVAIVAALLLDAGASVTVVAESGRAAGRAAFTHRGVTLDARAACEPLASLDDWLAANLPSFDHILIASHGAYGRAGGSIVLPSSTMSIADLLATSGLAPGCTVHLNACETAMRLGLMYSLAGGLFQLGAGLVVGTAWTVHDRDALAISSAVYQAVSRGEPWERAVVAAMRGLRDEVGDDAVERWSPFLTMVG